MELNNLQAKDDGSFKHDILKQNLWDVSLPSDFYFKI